MPENVRKAFIERIGKSELELRVLHQYFFWADRMRVHFEQAIKKPTPPGIDLPLFQEPEKWLYMSYWYAAMYVVIEGWQQLKLSDERVDELLSNEPFVQALKRYRNGVFHYQKKLLDERFIEFIAKKEGGTWIHDLRTAISDFFLHRFGLSEHASPKGNPPK